MMALVRVFATTDGSGLVGRMEVRGLADCWEPEGIADEGVGRYRSTYIGFDRGVVVFLPP